MSSPSADDAGQAGRVRGSTTIGELLRRHPEGAARKLLAELGVPCAYCGGAVREPITLAARRHGRDPGAFLRACQALDAGWPGAELIAEARQKKQER